MLLFLTVLQAIVGALLVGVILMQKSEGGGLGVGGSPTGLMSARGAADFLTRATAVLATLFVVLSIVLATLAVKQSSGRKIDDSLNRAVAPAGGAAAPAPSAAPIDTPAAAPTTAPVADPLRDATKL